jgi:hypothetical protein
MDPQDIEDVPLIGTEEAIAEVRRWLDEERVDPERVFTSTGEQTIRYKDLIAHLERETPDGRLLRFAISRGRLMKRQRTRTLEGLLQIRQIGPPPAGGKPAPSDPPPSDDPGSPA